MQPQQQQTATIAEKGEEYIAVDGSGVDEVEEAIGIINQVLADFQIGQQQQQQHEVTRTQFTEDTTEALGITAQFHHNILSRTLDVAGVGLPRQVQDAALENKEESHHDDDDDGCIMNWKEVDENYGERGLPRCLAMFDAMARLTQPMEIVIALAEAQLLPSQGASAFIDERAREGESWIREQAYYGKKFDHEIEATGADDEPEPRSIQPDDFMSRDVASVVRDLHRNVVSSDKTHKWNPALTTLLCFWCWLYASAARMDMAGMTDHSSVQMERRMKDTTEYALQQMQSRICQHVQHMHEKQQRLEKQDANMEQEKKTAEQESLEEIRRMDRRFCGGNK